MARYELRFCAFRGSAPVTFYHRLEWTLCILQHLSSFLFHFISSFIIHSLHRFPPNLLSSTHGVLSRPLVLFRWFSLTVISLLFCLILANYIYLLFYRLSTWLGSRINYMFTREVSFYPFHHYHYNRCKVKSHSYNITCNYLSVVLLIFYCV